MIQMKHDVEGQSQRWCRGCEESNARNDFDLGMAGCGGGLLRWLQVKEKSPNEASALLIGKERRSASLTVEVQSSRPVLSSLRKLSGRRWWFGRLGRGSKEEAKGFMLSRSLFRAKRKGLIACVGIVEGITRGEDLDRRSRNDESIRSSR